MTVYVEKDGPLTTIVLSRPEVRNAVDRQTAKELADVFRSFENDKAARVAVFSGDQGQFCAGADLKKIAEGKPNRMEPAGDGPMGPTRMRLSKPVIAAISPAMRWPAVSNWRSGATSDSWKKTPSWEYFADAGAFP
jgi:enoyl-CoA hydratase